MLFIANDWFKERDYPQDMINKETKRALESPSLGRSKTSERSVSGNGGTGVPVVVNYNPIFCRFVQVIRKSLFFFYIKIKKLNNYLTLPPLFHFVVLELLGAT